MQMRMLAKKKRNHWVSRGYNLYANLILHIPYPIRLGFLTSLIFCIVIALNLSALYASTSTETHSGSIGRPIGMLTAGTEVRQDIDVRSMSGKIHSVSINFANYARPDYHLQKALIYIDLMDSNELLRRETVVVGSLEDNVYHTIKFKPVSLSLRNHISVRITAVDTTSDNAPTIWLASPKASGSTPDLLSWNGSQLDTVLDMHLTYTHLELSSLIPLLLVCLLPFSWSIIKGKSLPSREQHWFKLPVLLTSSLLLYAVLVRYMDIFGLPVSGWAFWLPAILYIMIFLLLLFLTNRMVLSLGIVQTLFTALFLINFYKMRIRGDSFLPSDIFAFREAAHFAGEFAYPLTSGIMTVVVVSVIILVLCMNFPSIKLHIVTRLVSFIAVIISLVLLFPAVFWDNNMLRNKLSITNYLWDQNSNYRVNGVFLSFFMNTYSLVIPKPQEYARESVLDSYKRLLDDQGQSAGDGTNTFVSPQNIIVIMNESFSDMRLINDRFSSIPFIPFYDSLIENTVRGNLVVPAFGGGTCNTEFEFLTGMSMALLPSGTLPYQQYIHGPIPSLAQQFALRGYKTLAIHPNDAAFWNRDKVYDHLGFEEFLSIHSFSGETANRGVHTDDSVYRLALDRITAEDLPMFIFAVTIQNHTPYTLSGSESQYNLQVPGDEDNKEVTTFLNLLRQSDQDLKLLIKALTDLDENTMLVFFGDHLPALGNGFYEKYNEHPEDPFSLYTTPFLIWTNYPSTEEAGLSMSSNFLGQYIMDRTGFTSDFWWESLGRLRKSIPVVNPVGVIGKNGEIMTPDVKSMPSLYLQDYQMIQFDLLFGKKYSAQIELT